MKSGGESPDAITDINVTPLVDIILVVLIIFMATAPLINRRAIKVDVPAAAHQETAEIEALEVVYNGRGKLYLAGRKVDRAELAATLSGMRRTNPNLRVMVAGDQTVSYGEMVGILDVVRGAGIRKASLEVRSR
ncbi:MAG: biopolymer transporter ExbD [Elusimicrobiota bacterium]